MRLTRFWAEGRVRFGIVADDSHVDLSREVGNFTELAAWSMAGLPSGFDTVLRRGERFSSGDVTRLIPLEGPFRIFCAALNYHSHAREVNIPPPAEPLFFIKFQESLIAPDANLISPPVTAFLDYEAELAVVIGRSGRNIPAEQALDHVLGFCVMNDVSARDLQVRKGPRPVMDWLSGKALDGLTPVGPHIVTRAEIGDGSDLPISATLNGEVVQQARTSDMIFSIPQLISYLSHRFALKPLDVIATGTPAGVGHARGRNLVSGDRVTISVPGVGELSNLVIRGG